MRLNREITICVAALVGTALGTASALHAQKTVCEHIGKWQLVEGRIVCAGDYPSGQCVWTDDCRVNVD